MIVPLYKGKDGKSECKNYREIGSLSIPGKLYGRTGIKRMKMTECRINEEQRYFRKGKVCVDHIFLLNMVAETYVAKRAKLYAVFMDLGKIYGRVNWNAIWKLLTICGVGEKFLDASKSFYKSY